MRLFATNYQVSSVKSGSGQPPDRAQLCPFADDVLFLKYFFSEPVSGPPKVNFKRGNAKKSVKNMDRARLEAPN